MRVPFACPVSLTMCSGMPTSNAKRIPFSRGPQIITGGLGSSIEWMSRRKSAASTSGRSRRARRSSVESRPPASVCGVHTRLKSSSTKRVAYGFAGSKRENASTLANARVSVPRVGASPSRSNRSTTSAPQISLPCVSAFTITWGPGLPLSKVWTNSVPVGERRWRSMSGAFNSTAMAVMGGSVAVVVIVIMRGTVGMVIAMAVVMVMIVVVVMAMAVMVMIRGAQMGAALRGIPRDHRQHAFDVDAQLLEARRLHARALVHVEPAVHLDLQAVPLRSRIRECAHQLHALVRVVDLHLVAHVAQSLGDQGGELRLASRAVAIAEHEVGACLARPLLGDAPAQGRHRVAIDVPYAPEMLVRRVEGILHGALVGLVEAHDALLHLLHR